MIFKNYNLQKSNGMSASIYNFKVKNLDNNLVDLNTKKNKVILIVNSASS